MRLAVTIIWLVAALCWLPWALILLRFILDLALGTSWGESVYLQPALIGLWPGAAFSWWPPSGWIYWRVVSVWPLAALAGCALSAFGWRVYWQEQYGVLTRPAWLVTLSIIAPILAPFIMWGDARRRHWEREARLERNVREAREKVQGEG
ncbi:MAG TPA: hypothetical protein ENO21_01340 [Firmicutes bacterium]|nr:hypothetical protein [Bacillota bacterium]